MKIIHYTATFSPLSQTFIYDLIKGLEDKGIAQNTVLTRRRELERERPFGRTYICKENNPIKKAYYNLVDPSHLIIRNKKSILNHIVKTQPDIIHTHFAISSLRMHDFLSSQSLNIPHICSFHGNDVLTNPHKIKGYHEALLKLNNYPKLLMTVPSQFLKDVCIKLGLNADKIKIVHNTVHPRFIRPDQNLNWDGMSKLKIITIGRLVEMKGHVYAIKAMALLKKSFPNFEYQIGGSGFLEPELKTLVTELGLTDHVKFLGNLSHEEVPRVLSESHICLIPSIRADDGEEDTFCLSLVEGSAVGLYCMSSDTRGPVEVLGTHKEFIFQQKSSEAIFEHLNSAIKDVQGMKTKAKILQDYMIKSFHPDSYFENYQKIYTFLKDS
jgi:colanic acid/amylovoran biosynthesis glycosyltransferase